MGGFSAALVGEEKNVIAPAFFFFFFASPGRVADSTSCFLPPSADSLELMTLIQKCGLYRQKTNCSVLKL